MIMVKLLAFLESFVGNLKQDLSKQVEVNLFTIIGFLLVQYLLLKKLGIDLVWASLIPVLCLLLFMLSSLVKTFVEARKAGRGGDFVSLSLTILAVSLSSIVACFYVRLLAINPVSSLEAILKGVPFSPIIFFYIVTFPLRKWLGKWGMVATYVIAFILVILKEPHVLGIGS